MMEIVGVVVWVLLCVIALCLVIAGGRGDRKAGR
jgi:hypothetical protein